MDTNAKKLCAVTLLVACSFACNVPANAQFPGMPQQKPKKTKEQQFKDNMEYTTAKLTKPATNLPGVPEYSGQKPKWVNGYQTPNLKAGYCVIQNYLCKEKKDIVLNWYEQALTSMGWKIDAESKRPNQIMAINDKDGTFFNVMVAGSGPNEPGYATSLFTRFRKAPLAQPKK